ncbi:Cytidyltransferase-like domain containing protein [uncultured Caudovirales phage]|uniref:Cytidyltransferase-like domain containing protein n=1 Tax=uncultured Caudovirales phage TaxID=2100421 RepID=A0A6J5KVK8_9CAUD|nr:Cytidyltransferase-like domain containing protein [uncultured Caudovirales phage]
MKNFRQLLKELPSKKVVFTFGRFQPPTIGHGLLISTATHIAEKQEADCFIYASRTQNKKDNPLPVDRKIYFLKRMFPKVNFVAAGEDTRTPIEVAKHLNKKYKNLILVVGSDRVESFTKLLNSYNGKEYNFDTIEVLSAGERDPDSDSVSGMSGTKMRLSAKDNDFESFKKGLPNNFTSVDAKRMMGELRSGMGLEVIKEEIVLARDSIRERYFRKEIFNVGDSVLCESVKYEIVKRGSNHLLLKEASGALVSKWIQDVSEDISIGYAPKEITFRGYTTKNLHHSADAAKAFQSSIEKYNSGEIKDGGALLSALKATDTYMKLNDMHLEQGKAPDVVELKTWNSAHKEAQIDLTRIGEFLHHEDYWHMHQHELEGMEANYTPATAGADIADSYIPTGTEINEMKFTQTDKIKVARIIAGTLGVVDVDKKSNPEGLINDALRKIRSKPMRAEYIDVLHKMLQTAKDAGIAYDEQLVPKKVVDEGTIQPNGTDKVGAVYEAGKKKRKGKETEDFHFGDGGSIQEELKSLVGKLSTAKMTNKPVADIQKKIARLRNVPKVNDSDMSTHSAEQDRTDKVNDSDIAADLKHRAAPEASIGQSMASGESTAVRKMKVRYATEAFDPFFNGGTQTYRKNPMPDIVAEDNEEDNVEDSELDKMADEAAELEDILDAYEDHEIIMVDDEGNEVDDEKDETVKEEVINEVLSRTERLRAKVRFAQSKSKRGRKLKLALKSRSSVSTLNKRARHLAVKMMEKRIARKPLNQLSVSEKERVEKVIQKRKKAINRLAMKLVSKIKAIETKRLAK